MGFHLKKCLQAVKDLLRLRNRKGLCYINSKSKDARLLFAGKLSTKVNYVLSTVKDKLVFVRNTNLPLDTRLGAGKQLIKEKIVKVYPFEESK